MVIFNDVHTGVRRVAGTTPLSTLELQQYLIDCFAMNLNKIDDDICILGDLFDSYAVDLSTVKAVGKIIRDWMREHSERRFILVRGNHDTSNNIGNVGSLDLVAWILSLEFYGRVQYVTDPEFITEDIFAVPHLQNQELFNIVVERIPDTAKLVLFHCNYDNFFAVEGDHSLNLSKEQAGKLLAKGMKLGFGHEHSKRQPQDDIYIFGNQWPSSISDCKGQEAKYYHHVASDLSITAVKCWDAEAYAEVDWRALDDTPPNVDFVRVVGDCESSESPQMVRAVADFRKSAKCFIVANAVKIAGVLSMEELPADMEEAKNFDALEVLFEMLKPEQVAKIKEVLKDDQAS